MSRAAAAEPARGDASSIWDKACCSRESYTISGERTAILLSRMTGPSPSSVGEAMEMNVAAARSMSCGNGTTIAASERSGSGTHIRIAIARRWRRGRATASAVPAAVQLLGVAKVLMKPQKSLLPHDRDNHHVCFPPTGGSPRTSSE
jgi:hypothetical protein